MNRRQQRNEALALELEIEDLDEFALEAIPTAQRERSNLEALEDLYEDDLNDAIMTWASWGCHHGCAGACLACEDERLTQQVAYDDYCDWG